MRILVAAALVALSACSDPQPTNVVADVNAAAAEAQGDIDTYAADRLTNDMPPRDEARTASAPIPAPVRSPERSRMAPVERAPVGAATVSAAGEDAAYRCDGATRVSVRTEPAPGKPASPVWVKAPPEGGAAVPCTPSAAPR